MQLAVTGYSWCDFFLCNTKDSFQQKINFDKSFWLVNKCKLEMFYSKIVVKELLKLVSAIFYQIFIFHEMIAFQKL